MALDALQLDLLQEGKRLLERLTELRRDFHRHPELSFQEKRTAGIVAETLQSLGFSVKTKVGGHGVVAELTGTVPGRIVALRADMDALPIAEETGVPFASQNPGVMHACGHDAHTAILLGAAELLAAKRDRLKGTVRLLFQSAEEINAGAKAMIEEGVLDGVEEIYGLHNLPTLPAGKIATRSGAMMGSVDRIEITLEGKGGHGAIPDQCVDPIVTASSVVMGLQTAVSRETSPFEPAVVTIGSFLAGQMNNVVPQRAELTGTVRTFALATQALMQERIERIVGRISEGYRCRSTINYIEQVPVLVNHAPCVNHVNIAADLLLGSENRVEAEPTLAGEDFSVYLTHVPGCFFWLGSGPYEGAEQSYGLHHPKFDINEACLSVGASLLAAIAMERCGSGGEH